MIKVNYTDLASFIINKALKIKPQEVVLIRGGYLALPFLEELVITTFKNGAFAELDFTTNNIYRRRILDVPEEYLSVTPKHLLRWIEDVDCIINVGGDLKSAILATIPSPKIRLYKKAYYPYWEKIHNRSIRGAAIGFPTIEEAKFYGFDFEEFHDIFWKAVDIDYINMRKVEETLASKLRGKNNVKITTPNGTDIILNIKDRPIFLDAGTLEEEDIIIGNIHINIPCGEVFVAPVEDSAEGVAVFEENYIEGVKFTNLKLTFNKGKIIQVEGENKEKFIQILERETGDKDRIAELGIGTNTRINRITGYNLLDEKISGTVHLAIGGNRFYGGQNSSTHHRDLIMQKPTIYIDGELLSL